MESLVDGLRAAINFVCEPKLYITLMAAWCTISVFKPEWWVSPRRFALIFGGFILLYCFSITDHNFQLIAFKGDNVPIIFMLFLLVFFTWLAFYRGHQNDLRWAAGKKLIEEEDGEVKVLVWPHLLYIEFIVGVFVTALLLLWSIGIQAPLEEPASAARTPNPSKAPWYFLGLQEMLVYFDPWMAGVVAPSLIVVGLMALPYLDRNPKGNGYYTLKERRFAIYGFCFGFLVLWIALILLGTAFRGPNWNFFGPFDFWDPHKQPVLNNINLSEIIYLQILGRALPTHWFAREIFGIVAVLFYVLALPPLLLKTKFFNKLSVDLGAPRYYTFMFLFLMMMSLPIKMVLRWTLNLKYLVYIPDYFLNI
ncbi:MAG: hypothetical protein R3C68_13380 [Myxococcota bacterium]